MLADTINQSEMQAARFHHNNIDVAMLKGNSSCGRPRTVNEDATPESGWSRARSASIARRLRVLCDKFESEEFGFERPLFDVNEGSRSHNQVVDAWFLRKLVRGWYGSCLWVRSANRTSKDLRRVASSLDRSASDFFFNCFALFRCITGFIHLLDLRVVGNSPYPPYWLILRYLADCSCSVVYYQYAWQLPLLSGVV